MFGINLGIILLLIMVVMGAGWAELTENSDHDWTITSTEAANLVDSIELSEGAKSFVEEASSGRSERIAQLRAAVEDGTLFDRDRLARAAERLLSDSV